MLSHDKLVEALLAVDMHGTITAAAEAAGIPRKTMAYRYRLAQQSGVSVDMTTCPDSPIQRLPNGIRKSETEERVVIDYKGVQIETLDQLLSDAEVDMSQWEVIRVDVNNWEVGGKIKQGQKAVDVGTSKSTKFINLPEKLWKMPLRQVRITLRPKTNERKMLDDLLEQIAEQSFRAPKIKRPKPAKTERKSLEVCLMDPHFGMQCYPPGADQAWSLDDCETIAMWAIDSLLKSAEAYAGIEEIIFPFGNDYLHHDNLSHSTTAGTPQPEGLAYHHIYSRGVQLAIAMVERLKVVAPVRVYQIPGNHDRQSSFTLGHVLWAYYNNDANVTVDASSSPYKFHKYGTNLIGFEHGHSIAPIRLAALMANECAGEGPRQGWWDSTTYREWHLGDQHRKGTSKPSAFEEQGVSIEYLAGLTPPNEWHKLKAYNWQKRGAVAFVWDYHRGPVARLQVNLNSYTGAPTGMKLKDLKKAYDR